jgi:hypothetical protein
MLFYQKPGLPIILRKSGEKKFEAFGDRQASTMIRTDKKMKEKTDG